LPSTCTGQCNARAFRLVGPIPGIAVPNRQEDLLGATSDGKRILYLAGQEFCMLDHLYLAERVGDRYESVDLTPQLATQDVHIREGCCTISRDGRTLLAVRKSAPGFVRFPLDGTRLGPPDTETAGQIIATIPPHQRIGMPVLSADERELYFMLSGDGTYRAVRTDRNAPFPAATKLIGRVQTYEYPTGISDDGLTLFMAAEFATRVLVRDTTNDIHGELAPMIMPSRLPGWRAIPIDGCQQIITTVTPGGCQGEEAVLFEAVRM
jgi:hypothetical protein